MEPTTAILFMALTSPALPTMVTRIAKSHQQNAAILSCSTTLAVPLPECVPTQAVVVPLGRERSRLEEALDRVDSLNLGASPDARIVLERLPSGFPIPHVAHGDDDHIVLFWDNDNAYADIELDGSGYLSVFCRRRVPEKEDRGCDDISVTLPFRNWGFDYLEALAPGLSKVA